VIFEFLLRQSSSVAVDTADAFKGRALKREFTHLADRGYPNWMFSMTRLPTGLTWYAP